MEIRDLRTSDGEELRQLWRASGIRIRPGDDDAALGAFAARNPALCLVGSEDDRIVASALAGWDGRRGIATRLVHVIEERLRGLGCKKLNLIVWDHEEDAMAFWEALGYRRERTVEFAKELAAE